jgi:hypothetical protein
MGEGVKVLSESRMRYVAPANMWCPATPARERLH